jgi:serine/threonine protein phosphatase PrpC
MLPSTEIVPCSPIESEFKDTGRRLRVSSFGMTDQGAVRETNEDQFLIATLTKAIRIQQISLAQAATLCGKDEGHVFLVADGFGGAPAGEQASALAVESIEAFLANKLKWFFRLKGPETEKVLAEFQAALREADARVFEEGAEHPELSGMGTTLTVAYSLRANLFVAHAGDSRCYLYRAPELMRLTHDHTLAEILSSNGPAPPTEADRRRLSHVITNAIGGRTPGVRAEVQKHSVQPGDILLLATDGLTRGVSDEQIAATLASERDPKATCERLVAQALDAGGRDNVTVLVARYEES